MRLSNADLILNNDGSVYHLSLKPEQVAENIIVVGDPGRVHRVSKHFDSIDFEMNKREFITHTGTYNKKRITVMSTGMGTDNIEIVMIELDALFNINLKKRTVNDKHKSFNIIRIGTSGALQEDLKVGSPIAACYGIGLDDMTLYYDIPQDETEKFLGDKLQNVLNMPYRPYCVKCSGTLLKKLAPDMVQGNTVTTPGFYAAQGRKLRIPTKNKTLLNDLLYFNHDGFWLTNFEMETSALYAFARLFGHHALSINAILANRIKGSFTKNPYNTIDAIIKKVLDRI